MSVVTLAQAKTHLNITGATHDAELQAFLDSCEAAVVRKVGPLAATATTSRADGGYVLTLPVTPVISLTSVTSNAGAVLTVGDLSVTSDGEVSYTTGGTFPAAWYTVVYSAGRAAIPDDLRLAVLELVRHGWETQRGPSRKPGSSPSDGYANTMIGAAYTFPFRVTELLASHLQVGV